MYATLLFLHSGIRYLVLLGLLLAVGKSWIGFRQNRKFTVLDNNIRHWTATIAHIQLVVGIILYIKSPLVAFFWKQTTPPTEFSFFSIYHAIIMFVAIITLTVGSALAKRKQTDQEKFKTILLWFTICLILIFIAIPWPFSPFVHRPYFRPF